MQELPDDQVVYLICRLEDSQGREALYSAIQSRLDKGITREDLGETLRTFFRKAFFVKNVEESIANTSIDAMVEAILDHDPFIENVYMDEVISKALQPLR